MGTVTMLFNMAPGFLFFRNTNWLADVKLHNSFAIDLLIYKTFWKSGCPNPLNDEWISPKPQA